jgi:hypothetical protein
LVIQTKKKINKETLELNDIIDQIDLTDVYRIFHPATTQYTFFSAFHGTFSKIDHILGHKTSINKYKKTKISPCILSEQRNKTQTQQQKYFQLQKVLIHLETEQHFAQWPMNGSSKKFKNS